MDKVKYLSELSNVLKENGKGKVYIKKCIDYAGKLLDNNLPVIFDVKHLALLIGIETKQLCKMIFDAEAFYIEKIIPKKSGGYRELFIPSVTLKYIQRWILDNIIYHMHISPYANGFCPNKSIVTNAKKHLEKECVINIDLKDFFPSINLDDVFRIFYYYGYTKEVSFALSKLCTNSGVLPQGSPASPYISNIICLKLDKRLSTLVEKYEGDYTRYADDITISGNRGIIKCLHIVEHIINDEGFNINHNKTRTAFYYQRQEVTGLVVNHGKVSINKEYKRKLKQEIYFCIKYGVNEHLDYIKNDKSFFKEHLYGKAYFVKMVEPEEGEKVLNMLDKVEWDY